jgi:glycosyltransferase involved in cell wall biosynthesis
MLIAIPSKGRSNNCPSYDRLNGNCTLFVPESELHQYLKKYKNVIPVPIHVKGITATRNWILKNTDERWVVMLDDDVKTAGYNHLHRLNTKKIEIKDVHVWVNEFKKIFSITEQLGYKIWGIRTESSPMGTYPYKPFLFKSYVTASCIGIINDGSYYFDERFIVKEDYEICLRHISEFGGIVAARYIHWENSHWEDEGGCKDYRTQKIEENCIGLLKELYPNLVSGVTRKNNKYTIKLSL